MSYWNEYQMARKLKGKIGNKGLKGALQRHQAQEKLKSKLQSQKLHEINKNKPKKAVAENQKLQRENAPNFIPFTEKSTLLLVGEGDFSFARSIVEQDYIQPENLIVTSYDTSATELHLKYPHSFDENYKFLTDAGVKILFKIDATNLIKSLKLTKKTPWPKVVGQEWRMKRLNNIMFNFPHTGRGIKDQDRNIREHQELVFGFFDSCKQLFELINNGVDKILSQNSSQGYSFEGKNSINSHPETVNAGKVILSLFAGEPYDSWQIKILAKKNGWTLERSNKFQWELYPEYHHKRTNSEQDTTKPALERDARIYVFETFNKKKHSKSQKRKRDTDDERQESD